MINTTNSARSCALKLKVLSDEVRLAIVGMLLRGAKSVGEINEHIQIEQNALSHHLRVLRESGLVVSERKGKQVEYRVSSLISGHPSESVVDLHCCKLYFNKKNQSKEKPK